ncbi:unnamed protein product [Cladocopium goreaui]|uniref:Uncharacterized protein n=1 Tax=Cladocopium goreaui TaxID=2562237 RepID=A0A9P1GIP9_9DINO|nr:unnamed protein product [Cladocopium goreaui]
MWNLADFFMARPILGWLELIKLDLEDTSELAHHHKVYMRDDLTYCSSSCRDRGLSRLYVNLKQSQLEGPRLPSGASLQTASNYKSESSLATKTERTEITEVTEISTSEEMDWGRLGRLAKIGQRVIDALLKRVASKTWGAQVLRTYSTSVLWGREVAENSAVAPLFNYLPQVDQYMQKDLSFDMSPRSDRRRASDRREGTLRHSLESLGKEEIQVMGEDNQP